MMFWCNFFIGNFKKYFDRSNKRKWLYTKKARSRQYPAETMTDEDYADDIVLLANALAQAEPLLHSLEQATGDIVFYVNANKTEYMRFKQEVSISTLRGARGVMVIVTGYGHGDTSSIPGQD